MSGNSSVGQRSVYEAGDQRNYKDSEIKTAERYKEGKENSHKSNDSSTPEQNLSLPNLMGDFTQRMNIDPICIKQRMSVQLRTD